MREDQAFWETKWRDKATGWDIGTVSTPLKMYADQLMDKDMAILIPGCGNAYEAEYLVSRGFTDITLIDISPTASALLADKFNKSPQVKVHCVDFFEHEGQYDIILEQTFFCALPPSRREDYVRKMLTLLKPGGELAGVLFDKIFLQEGPPFGGEKDAYKMLFEPWFHLLRFDPCYNSIPQRAGSEIFIRVKPKSA